MKKNLQILTNKGLQAQFFVVSLHRLIRKGKSMAEFILGVVIIFILSLLVSFGLVILAGAMIDYVTNDNTDDDCF